jgi:hypothetical protein
MRIPLQVKYVEKFCHKQPKLFFLTIFFTNFLKFVPVALKDGKYLEKSVKWKVKN